jgi:hypothetical protein
MIFGAMIGRRPTKRFGGRQAYERVAHKHLCGLMTATLIVSAVFVTVRAIAAQIEEPSTASAAAILGSPLRGANYETGNAVRSDDHRRVSRENEGRG